MILIREQKIIFVKKYIYVVMYISISEYWSMYVTIRITMYCMYICTVLYIIHLRILVITILPFWFDKSLIISSLYICKFGKRWKNIEKKRKEKNRKTKKPNFFFRPKCSSLPPLPI